MIKKIIKTILVYIISIFFCIVTTTYLHKIIFIIINPIIVGTAIFCIIKIWNIFK